MMDPETVTCILSIGFAQVLADFAAETSDIHNMTSDNWQPRPSLSTLKYTHLFIVYFSQGLQPTPTLKNMSSNWVYN